MRPESFPQAGEGEASQEADRSSRLEKASGGLAVDRVLIDAVHALMLAVSNASRMTNSPLEELEGPWNTPAQVTAALGFNKSSMTQWRVGDKRGIPIHRRLWWVFFGEELPSNKRNNKRFASVNQDRRAKAFLKYWKERYANELNIVQKLLEEHESRLCELRTEVGGQRNAKLRADFARRATASTLNFMIDPTAAMLPVGLRPGPRVIPREGDVGALLGLLDAYAGEGTLVSLVGPPRGGKSVVLRQFVSALTTSPPASGRPRLALLHLDFNDFRRPIRALHFAVFGRAGPVARNATVMPGEDDEAVATPEENILIELVSRIGPRTLVSVIEAYTMVVDQHRDELERILKLTPFRCGFTVLESDGDRPSAPSLTSQRVTLRALTVEEAADVLEVLYGFGGVALEAVSALSDEFRYVGILRKGAEVFSLGRPDHDRKVPTAEGLELSILFEAAEIADNVVRRLCAASIDVNPAMLTLMAMAALDEIPIDEATRQRAGLAPIPRAGLVRIGWMEAAYGGDLLIGFGRDALRGAAGRTLRGKNPSGQAPQELTATLTALASDVFRERDDRRSRALERTVNWLMRHLPEQDALLLQLQALLSQEAALDPVPPFSAGEGRVLAINYQRCGLEQGNIDLAIASLSEFAREVEGRSSRPRDEISVDFVKSLDAVIGWIGKGAELGSRQLDALDNAVFVGVRRLRLFEAAGRFYRSIAPVLEVPRTAITGARETWLSAWPSLLMNAADLSLQAGDSDAARKSIRRAGELLEGGGGAAEDAKKAWLFARLALLRERLAGSALEGREQRAAAAGHAERLLAHARHDPRSLRYYLGVVQRQVRAEGDEELRCEHVEEAIGTLEAAFGPRDEWGVAVRAQTAALMYSEARRSWDVAYQNARVREALKLLRKSDGSGGWDVALDYQACLVQARLQSFLGQRDAALRSCDASIDLAPTPAAWYFKLRLLDGSAGSPRGASAPEDVMPPELEAGISAFRTWAKDGEARSAALGRIELWIHQRQWRGERSLERWAEQEWERTGSSRPFMTLPASDRVKRFEAVYERRLRAIKKITANFDGTPDVIVARFELEAQYRRSVAVARRDEPNVGAALRIIEDALSSTWRGDHLLQFRKAEYQRYIWDLDAAILGFREVKANAVDGDLRRRAAVGLVRTLHARAVSSDDPSHGPHRDDLEEARRLADDLTGAFDHAEDIVILKDHIALELGEQIDWTDLENSYDQVIKCINGPRATLFIDISTPMPNISAAPSKISDALLGNYADPEVLGLASGLYLRRAEKGFGNDQPEDYARAFALNAAKGLLERSWEGQERPVTSFKRACMIIGAAETLGRINPISELYLEGNKNQLDHARSLLQSAADRSAGRFKNLVMEWHDRAKHVRRRLLARPAGITPTGG